MSDDAAAFGNLVREARQARGWTQETLAAEAFSNLDRKGYVSRIENGKIPNITRAVVKQLADTLDIDRERIPEPLRWPEAVAVVKDTNTVAHEVQAQLADLQETIDRLADDRREQAREWGIKEGMLIALARNYAEETPEDFDAALRGLEQALQVAHEEAESGRLPSNTSDAVDAVIAKVDALNADGAFEEAQALLDAEEAALEEEAARQAAMRLRLYDKGLAQARYRADPESAAAYELKRLTLERAADDGPLFPAIRALKDEWYVRGRDKGLAFDLEVAIHLAPMAHECARDADERGTALNDLGTALATLGERDSGTARLEEAVRAFRAALEEYTRERVPLHWATTQNNLGNALRSLGERESGTARLTEAVRAYRAALQERTRARVPLDWAMTQNNLGTALWTLGARESGTARLEEAVRAYRAALQERTRARVPLDWAMTQNNLGTALWTLGARESGTARLTEAVRAYRAALQERTRARVPLDWAATQNNLGNALQTLGARESGTARLEEAVRAFRAALEEYTRERVPLAWAAIQNNLGAALAPLGARESGTARLEEAVRAYHAALQERTRARVPLDWAATQENIAIAEKALAGKTGGAAARAHLSAAREAVDAALTVFDPAESPFYFDKATRLRAGIVAALDADSGRP